MFFMDVSRGHSRSGVHSSHPRRLPIGLSVSASHEAPSGGLEVKILFAGKETESIKANIADCRARPNLMSLFRLVLQIIILWNSEKPPPNRNKWPPMPVPLIVTDGRRKVRSDTSNSSDGWVTAWQTVAQSLYLSLTPCLRGSLSLILLHHLYLRLFSAYIWHAQRSV